MIDQRARPDKALPTLAKLPTLNADANEPILPIESAEPTEPMDNTDPVEAMDKMESCEAMLQRDRVRAGSGGEEWVGTPRVWRGPRKWAIGMMVG